MPGVADELTPVGDHRGATLLVSRFAILVIEDERDMRLLIRELFEEHGYQVREAADGVSGLAEVAREAPDLVLVDLNLPLLGGWEVCRHLKADERTRRIPVLMMTAAYLSQQDAQKGLALGADEYIEKPFVPDVLLHNVERLLHPDTAPAEIE